MDTNAPSNIALTKYKFTALYVVSVVLLGIIITAILDPLVPQKTSLAPVENSGENPQVSNTVQTLEASLQELYNLDKQYNLEKDPAKLAALEPIIASAEQSLQKALDSLENGNSTSTAKVTTASVASIASSYNNALNLHKLFRATSANTGSSDNNDELAQSLTELQAREERIKELESQLEASKSKGNSGSNKQVNELRNALEREADKNKKLIQASNTQKQTIEKLTKQVKSLQDFIHKR